MAVLVLHVQGHAPSHEGSYDGEAWDKAGIRHRYKQYLTTLSESMELRDLLTPHVDGAMTISSVRIDKAVENQCWERDHPSETSRTTDTVDTTSIK